MPESIALKIDCMEYMKTLPAKYFDLAVVDPPYGIGDFIQGVGRNKKSINWVVNWNDSIPSEKYFRELRRVSENRIIWGANYYNCFDGLRGAIIWNKFVTHPDMSKAEIASVSHYKKVEIVNIEWNGFIKSEKEKGIHPCQKPIALYSWIFKKYAKPNDKIFDSHLGSGSSRIAAHKAGLDFVGCEIDEDYFNAQEKRFADYLKQVPMEFKRPDPVNANRT